VRGSGIRIPLWTAFILVAAQFVGAAGAQQIQFAEPVSLTLGGSTAQFDAYGRRFSLTLTDNERVLSKLPVQRKQQLQQQYRLVRGSLDGQPGSWVRLTESGAGIEGAIWDGHDLYAVTRYGKIASKLTTPLAAGPDQTVVFRLSDTLEALPKSAALEDRVEVGVGVRRIADADQRGAASQHRYGSDDLFDQIGRGDQRFP